MFEVTAPNTNFPPDSSMIILLPFIHQNIILSEICRTTFIPCQLKHINISDIITLKLDSDRSDCSTYLWLFSQVNIETDVGHPK